MKLKKIAVSGFKSFVDLTNVSFNTQIAGVVGPNGCGKSNVIDAVRWVMGESSAKMLRGDSMEDVIFNGSSARKPVGRASVELVFDNSLGRIKSYYKDFSEIAVKRILGRDGRSDYRINDKRVRRKDVLDVFRGTGLGPRSYSIIEQGMVSRIVEAKPEELRAYVEEAAGISRYKDRRRETENRIRVTRENIERSEDIRSELLAQLRRLKRQAQTAERYKKLQQKRRDKTALLYRLRFDAYTAQIAKAQQKLEKTNRKLEQKQATQREIEAAIERKRSEQGEAQDKLSDIQAEFYRLGADISKIEQQIEHLKVTEEQDAQALSEVNDALAQMTAQIETDESMLSQYRQELVDLAPSLQADEVKLNEMQQAYEQARDAFSQWQQQANQQRQQAQAEANKKQLQLSIIDQINRQQDRALDRRQQLETEHARLQKELENTNGDPHAAQLKSLQDNFDHLQALNSDVQQREQEANEMVENLKNQLSEQHALKNTTDARIQSLQEFQVAALSNRHKEYRRWLTAAGLDSAPRLATLLRIKKGWERAADRILAPYLNSRIDSSGKHEYWLNQAEYAVMLVSIDRQKHTAEKFALESLASCVSAKDVDIKSLIAGVYIAEDCAQAQRYRLKLKRGERIVTKAGVVYGANWVSHSGTAAANTGYLVRAEEVKTLTSRIREIDKQCNSLEKQLHKAQQEASSAKAEAESLQLKQDEARQQIAEMQRDMVQLNTAQEYTQSRVHSIVQELDEINAHGEQELSRLSEAEQLLKAVEAGEATIKLDESQLLEQEKRARSRIEQSNLAYREQQGVVQARKLEQTRLETSVASLESSVARMGQQLIQHKQRKQKLLDRSDNSAAPLKQLNQKLQSRLAAHQAVEVKLLAVRDEITGMDNALRERQSDLSSCIEAVNAIRGAQENTRMALQDKQVRQQSLVEEAARDNCKVDEVELPEACPSINECEYEISEFERKIASIGAVNLVAIDEYESQSERAEYLEKQHKDLLDALETLEQVIRKIDKETRVRFEKTYTALNKSFSDYFPKLFGGGKASLSLTSDDWLTTGITVMAQPPGKRNSTIHLLSGGEKALAAVSLLFALFELNPAPFCMMDEVDAPLDDANVDRFCDTLKSLSEHAQIIVITHNKITMQAADSLIGVTMNEPGVSRVVSVDITQAMEMVEE